MELHLQPITVHINGRNEVAALVHAQRVDQKHQEVIRSHQMLQHTGKIAMLFTSAGVHLQSNASATAFYSDSDSDCDKAIFGTRRAGFFLLEDVFEAMVWDGDMLVR